ncbi:MAG: hypothetical protein M5U09_25305 [Gammaproteobacteria bacterium]|nr:hypothetical protein [Gammaproteobacteria bacterium]
MEAAERLVFETVLQQEAAKQGVVPTPEEIDARVNELIQQRSGGDAAQFAQWMGRTGSTSAGLRRQVAIELMDIRLRSKTPEVTDEKPRSIPKRTTSGAMTCPPGYVPAGRCRTAKTVPTRC